ncbi:MAG: VWA domain-containing protein [Bryobacteraceae bacterium]|nr:VWA domain-containing protein [Bryobacteraceae bacterium]
MRFPLAISLVVVLAAQQPDIIRFETSASLVVVNVTVRDKSGKPIPTLKKEDFRIYEDGKLQTLTVFEFQSLSAEKLPALEVPKFDPKAPKPEEPEPVKPNFSDRRALALFFDFAGMPPIDQVRARDAAIKFLSTQLTAADLVGLYTFSSTLKTVVDFTDDRQRLIRAVQSFRSTDLADDFASNANADDPDSANAELAADEAEFNVFNTDRRLGALEDLVNQLAKIPEKKAVIYFASGVSKTGVENQSQLQATVNAAVKGNVSFYPIDTRGLQVATGLDASVAAPRGSGVFSGKFQSQARDKFNNEQETLHTLAADTGGKALLDSNDLTLGMVEAQKSVESYYTLAYYSANTAKDGRFRKIRIELPPTTKYALDYRAGYYADKVWSKLDDNEREKQLADALALGNPATDLPLAVELLYFRQGRGRQMVPLAIKIPGSKIPLAKKGSTQLDFIAQVKDARGRIVQSLRDEIKLKLGANAGQLASKSLLYDAVLALAPGDYSLKALVRENQSGTMGTFEARFRVPGDPAAPESAVSSLVIGAQREPLSAAVGDAGQKKKLAAMNPLVFNGSKLVPSVTHVFKRSQTLHAFAEVYQAGSAAATLAVYQGRKKIYESSPLRGVAVPNREGVMAITGDLPLRNVPPGEYTCQLNIVDAAGGRFAFRRTPLVITP